MDKFKAAVKHGGFGSTGTGPPPTDDLTMPTKDSVFLAQLGRSDPTALDAESLLTGKICETSHYSHSVFGTLQKEHVIDKAGHPDTSRIDKSLVNKIAILPAHKCRAVVNMLFWWEEELMRWKMLDDQIAEVLANDQPQEREEHLAVLEAKKQVVPSKRMQNGSIKPGAETLPQYSE